MKIIEQISLPNGAHRNQITSATIPVPSGWAVIPENIETPNFPFGEVEAEEINGVMTVTRWTAGKIPDPAPDPQPTLSERVTNLEANKAEQTDVDELNEALNMILTGYTGEEAGDETGTA